ncbi:DNA repair protein RecN [Propionibacterium sp. NM47_B9-13]|jgi:DNA repair protein RecN (Recombination protein N)|uniref:DNA repair protein RecN n=2 Tax=Cutibacterium modestum TaxID=2559073 RepID=A0AAD1NV93_9ACTN|nr:DNA repair protein RecN [Cutibacterium modestum]TGY27281.1 DNA repair protein RecN [Propionibacterium sp. NM47_B9-13]AOH45136.1 DNA repair protein RecN [Cutibacterium modestum]EFS75225.1 DNA repair protein RecN [Cutibacterium modestum HL037PA2]EFS91112.1 DNA repair protein RecN [Cutibacterium modestum HL044PA1]EFT16814.1 DNA repair protein RecN [Cutibacterium modestum HL037PA3]
MIRSVRIRGLGVIDETLLEPSSALTAVTGETGAGKTMVVTGIGLLLGDKADTGLVRHGCDRAVVEAILDAPCADRVNELGGTVEDDEVICARHITTRRSRALLGGAQVTASQLARIVGDQVTIYGQSEQVRLVDASRQLDVVDRAAGDDLSDHLSQHAQLWSEFRAVSQRLHRLNEDRAGAEMEREVLTRRVGEVDAVDPKPHEDDDLIAEIAGLQAAQSIRESLRKADALLNGLETSTGPQPGALALLEQAVHELDATGDADPQAAELAERARQMSYDLTDLAASVAGHAARAEADPQRLEELGGRLAAIQRLLRARTTTLDDLLETTAADRRRLTELDPAATDLGSLGQRVEQLRSELRRSADHISAVRRRTAVRLAAEVRPELTALAMPHARLELRVEPAPMGPRGADSVTIMLAANPGSDPAPLAKAASGGELSRVRLALEVVAAQTLAPQTFVFDEIDSGVGGAVGIEIGRRLRQLARRHQVIVVTHLAQVAAFADTHVVISKASDGAVTSSGLREVTGSDREIELSRMMSGMVDSESGLEHAHDLLREAGERDG